MKESYSRPTITNANTVSSDGMVPLEAAAKAAAAGYSAGKAVRKVFGAEFSSAGEVGIVKRKKFMD